MYYRRKDMRKAWRHIEKDGEAFTTYPRTPDHPRFRMRGHIPHKKLQHRQHQCNPRSYLLHVYQVFQSPALKQWSMVPGACCRSLVAGICWDDVTLRVGAQGVRARAKRRPDFSVFTRAGVSSTTSRQVKGELSSPFPSSFLLQFLHISSHPSFLPYLMLCTGTPPHSFPPLLFFIITIAFPLLLTCLSCRTW